MAARGRKVLDVNVLLKSILILFILGASIDPFEIKEVGVSVVILCLQSLII